MRVCVEASDLAVLVAAARVMRKALEESGGDPEVLDSAVANIARVMMEPSDTSALVEWMFSDN
jgi:hypothetical protein